MGENQREVMAEMMRDPKALKKQLDFAQGRISKDAYIRFLVSWGSVASMDLANELKYYNREDKYLQVPEGKRGLYGNEKIEPKFQITDYDYITPIPERIMNIQEGLK